MHTPNEGKSDDIGDSFYDKVEHVSDEFLKYHREILLGISVQK
jgi:hypothetical protein